MNNKIKTFMILSTTTIALLAVMLAPSDAFADHWYGGSILPNGDAGFWFHCTSLDSLSVDWDRIDNCQKVTDSVEDSMSTYSNLGNDIDLTTTSTFTDYIVDNYYVAGLQHGKYNLDEDGKAKNKNFDRDMSEELLEYEIKKAKQKSQN